MDPYMAWRLLRRVNYDQDARIRCCGYCILILMSSLTRHLVIMAHRLRLPSVGEINDVSTGKTVVINKFFKAVLSLVYLKLDIR